MNEDNGWPPLFYAIAANRLVAVERLVDLGASLTALAKVLLIYHLHLTVSVSGFY